MILDKAQAAQLAHQKGAEIADILLRDGLPLVGFAASDMGAKIAFAFQLEGERAKYAFRVPVEDATVERVKQMYEAVA